MSAQCGVNECSAGTTFEVKKPNFISAAVCFKRPWSWSDCMNEIWDMCASEYEVIVKKLRDEVSMEQRNVSRWAEGYFKIQQEYDTLVFHAEACKEIDQLKERCSSPTDVVETYFKFNEGIQQFNEKLEGYKDLAKSRVELAVKLKGRVVDLETELQKAHVLQSELTEVVNSKVRDLERAEKSIKHFIDLWSKVPPYIKYGIVRKSVIPSDGTEAACGEGLQS